MERRGTVYISAMHSHRAIEAPGDELRILGDERALFEFYLLNNGSFKGCVGRGDARPL